MQLGEDKPPGPNGFLIIFFKFFWSLLKEDILAFATDFFDKGIISKDLGASFITLIPKKPGASALLDSRPISLLSGPYKILAKVLANRLKAVLPYIIFPV